jgi:hypothetical protein
MGVGIVWGALSVHCKVYIPARRLCAAACGAQVMAGQGTVAWELLEQAQDGFDAIIVPVGGGGLIGGIAAVIKAWRPDVQVGGGSQLAVWLGDGRHCWQRLAACGTTSQPIVAAVWACMSLGQGRTATLLKAPVEPGPLD